MSAINRLSALFLIVSVLTSPMALQAAEPVSHSKIQQDFKHLLQSENLSIRGVDILTQDVLLDVYEDHEFAPYWTNPVRIKELLELITDSADHGLIPADYNIEQLHRVLQQRQSSPSAEIEAEADILLMESLLRYGYHRRYGKVKASTLDPDINFKREKFFHQGYPVTIEEMLDSESLFDFIEMVAATGPVYQHLQTSLKTYRGIASDGGWPAVPDGPTLRLGDNDLRVAIIRKRLAVTGRIEDHNDLDSTVFDQALKDAVRAFQERHLLGQDGVVGKQTIATLNVPVEQRIDQLRLSLERLRWVRQEATDTMAVVNIAGFRALYFKDGELAWETPVMVGKNYRQTPVFTGDIAYLEFNPTWTIPPGILRNDTLPAIKKNPNYLESKKIQVIDNKGKIVDPSTVDWNKYTRSAPYTFRQVPGPHNSLGTVKFIFPNKHFVFLHDTPHRELFSQSERNFSSGCIRVKDPLTLAELILDDPVNYNRSKLIDIIDSRKTQRINPSTRVPVIIIYLTASVNSDGKTRFFRDIYKRDLRALDALNGPVIIQPPDA
jgi:murein L,D-transpeptidase YcbB/YkuD